MRPLVNLFKGQAPDGTYEDAARREAMAQALRERAMRQRSPQAGGPVQAQYGIGEGLTQLAEALLARRAGRSAIDTKKQADTQQTQRNDETLREMLPATEMQSRRYAEDGSGPVGSAGRVENMQSDALSMALRGQDPQAIGKFLAERKLQTLLPDPAEVADRDFKMFQVSATMADKAEARQQRLQELELRLADQALNREQRAAAAAEAAALRREIAAAQQQTQRDIAAGQQQASRDAAAARGDARRDAAQDKRDGRIAALEATRGALTRMQQTSDTLGSGGGFIEGRIPAVGPVAQDFDGAKAQLLANIQSALRVPGIGAQSNMELQALMAALPERTQEQEVRNNQIKGIADRLNIIIDRELGGGVPSAPTAPAAPAAGGMSFATEAEAEAAAAAGRLKPGTKVVIGGVSGTWQ